MHEPTLRGAISIRLLIFQISQHYTIFVENSAPGFALVG